MGREKRNYWHRYSSYRTDAGDIDLFLIAGPSIREIIERYTDLTGKSVMLPKAALGYLGSSMYYPELPENSDDAVLDFIDTTREEGIPCRRLPAFLRLLRRGNRAGHQALHLHLEQQAL